MGNCTATIKKIPSAAITAAGRASIVDIALSNSYATGGDTVTLASLGFPDGVDMLEVSGGATTPAGHAVEVIHGATPATAPKLRIRDVATGAEITAATDLSAQKVRAIAYQLPYA